MTNLNNCNIRDLRSMLAVNASIGKTTMIFGTFGIGKSAIAAQFAAENDYAMVDFRASEVLPEDVGGIGIPMQTPNQEPFVVRAIPDLVSACRAAAAGGRKVLLFLDEITSAVPAVQAALYQVALDKKAGMHALPEGTFVVMAGNLETDNGVVETMARPLLNRCSVLHFAGPTLDEFKPYMADRGFSPIIQAFLATMPSALIDVNPDNEQSATPRAWEYASEVLLSDKLPRNLRLLALASAVGDEYAAKLEAYLTISDTLIPLSAIYASPETAPVPNVSNFAAVYMQVVSLSNDLRAKIKALPGGVLAGAGAQGVKDDIVKAWTYTKRASPEVASLFLVNAAVGAVVTAIAAHDPTLFHKDSPYAATLSLMVGAN